jgi:Ca2+-dependent lipid-binding protein
VMVWPFMCHVGLVLFVAWMASCYHFNVPLVSVLGFIYLFKIYQRQHEKLIRRRRHEEKKGANKLRMEEGETVRWMNEALEIIWPIFMESFVSQILVKPLTWFLNQYKPWTAKKMLVQSMRLGNTPPIITMIRILAQPMEGDDLAIEASLEFLADKHMSSVLAVQVRRRIGLGLWTTVHISNVHLEGKVRIGIKFVKGWPLIGRIRLCFATAPYVQVTACPLFNSGVDIAELPLIAEWLDRFLADALTNSLVEVWKQSNPSICVEISHSFIFLCRLCVYELQTCDLLYTLLWIFMFWDVVAKLSCD